MAENKISLSPNVFCENKSGGTAKIASGRFSCPRVILAGTHSGVGKTTITMGLLKALKNRNISVQPYKIGPDYIDSGFHSRIAGRICRNLDSFFLPNDVLLELFSRQAKQVSFSVIEGVMGMYDGLAPRFTRDSQTGSSKWPKANSEIGSTAHAAKILRSPVILIIDAAKMAASAGAVVLGYREFDRNVNIAGCIVNQVAGVSHYRIIKDSIEQKSGVKVLGYLPKNLSFALPERHLGLTPIQEVNTRKMYAGIAKTVEKFIDIDMVVKIGKGAPALPDFKKTIFITNVSDKPSSFLLRGISSKQKRSGKKVTIAIARDKSFHFYYQDNLDILEHFGARLRFFSPLNSKTLPGGACGVYIGGGFPEMFAKELASNRALLKELKNRSLQGMPIYAECGGLMYLMKELETLDKKVFSMAGIFPGRIQMGNKLRMFGYYDIKAMRDNIISKRGFTAKGHLFHWSYAIRMPKEALCAFQLRKGGKTFPDGYMKDNTLVSYVHLHFGSNPAWAKRFVEQCKGGS